MLYNPFSIAGKHIIEMGAHWIHGEEGNAVHEWASKNGLLDEEASVTQTGEYSIVKVTGL